MNILDWIDVGQVSAERDENLKNYFYDNGTLKKLIDNEKYFLMLGRKGSGKTALFNYFTQHYADFINRKDIVVSISLDDYSWNVHALLSQNQAASSLAYRQSWRFIFLLEAIKQLAKIDDIGKPVVNAQKTMEKIFGCPIPSMFDLIQRKIFKLSRIKLPKGGIDMEDLNIDSFEIDAGEVAFEDVSSNEDLRSSLLYNIEGITNYLEKAIQDVMPIKNTIYICFDRVDEAWDINSKDVSIKVITGLIVAADSLTQKYKGKIRPLIFIREDIFETLPLNDKNKLREDCGSLLKWDKDGLFNLLLGRLNYYGKKHNINVSNLDDLFDRSEMRQNMKPSNYILKRTMFRPRDLICFFSKIISVLHDQQNDPFGDTKTINDKLLVDSIYEAESQYSEWLLEEIKEEWSVQAPEIRDFFDALQNNGSTVITKDELKSQLAKLGLTYDTPSQFIEHLKFLYNNSILGFKIGKQNLWRFKCIYMSQGFSDENEYHIHDGLTKALNLSEPRNTSMD